MFGNIVLKNYKEIFQSCNKSYCLNQEGYVLVGFFVCVYDNSQYNE